LKILEGVKETYNQIGEKFSITRAKIWPEFKFLKNLVKENQKVLDIGCGNGRFSELFSDSVKYIGVDISEKMLAIAKERYPRRKFILFDGLNLPFADESFDLVICIAVFHHLPSEELRQVFLKEIKRVLKKEGKLVLTVWYLWKKIQFWRLFFKYTLLKILQKSQLDFFDVYFPWQKRYQRYLHAFNKNELKKEAKRAGFKVGRIFFVKRGRELNLCLIAEK